ncbi:hypothetical protein [Methylomonas sp. CM2]
MLNDIAQPPGMICVTDVPPPSGANQISLLDMTGVPLDTSM